MGYDWYDDIREDFFEMDNQPQSKVGWYIPWYTHWGRVIHFRRHCEKLMTRLFRDGWPYHTIPQKKYRGEHVGNPCQSCEPSGPLHWRLNPFASLKWIDPRLNLGFQGGISMYFNVFQYLRGERLPSGKQPHNYGKSPFLMGKLTISMAIFNSYVKLPEGNSQSSCSAVGQHSKEWRKRKNFEDLHRSSPFTCPLGGGLHLFPPSKSHRKNTVSHIPSGWIIGSLTSK